MAKSKDTMEKKMHSSMSETEYKMYLSIYLDYIRALSKKYNLSDVRFTTREG